MSSYKFNAECQSTKESIHYVKAHFLPSHDNVVENTLGIKSLRKGLWSMNIGTYILICFGKYWHKEELNNTHQMHGVRVDWIWFDYLRQAIEADL